MRPSAKAKLSDVVNEWAGTDGCSQEDALTFIRDLVMRYGLKIWIKHHILNEHYEVEKEEFRKAVDNWAKRGWNNTELIVRKRLSEDAWGEYKVYLKDAYIWREQFRAGIEEMGIPLPRFWFPLNDESESRKQDRNTRTQAATRVREASVEERRRDLLEFCEKIYKAAKHQNLNWGQKRAPMPFVKREFLTVFQRHYSQYETKAFSTLEGDLQALEIKFASGTKSGKGGIERLENLFNS